MRDTIRQGCRVRLRGAAAVYEVTSVTEHVIGLSCVEGGPQPGLHFEVPPHLVDVVAQPLPAEPPIGAFVLCDDLVWRRDEGGWVLVAEGDLRPCRWESLNTHGRPVLLHRADDPKVVVLRDDDWLGHDGLMVSKSWDRPPHISVEFIRHLMGVAEAESLGRALIAAARQLGQEAVS